MFHEAKISREREKEIKNNFERHVHGLPNIVLDRFVIILKSTYSDSLFVFFAVYFTWTHKI